MTCLRCGEHVKQCRPWNGDVVEPVTTKPANGHAKTVAFSDDVTGGIDETEPETETEKKA